jgi:hypothetical protein
MSVVIREDGIETVHIQGCMASDYASLCGMAGEGEGGYGGIVVETKSKRKINCDECRSAWDICNELKRSDFV